MEYVIDNAEYRDAYISFIQQSKELGSNILDNLSIPMFSCGTKEYFASSLKVMILGQETAGNSVPLLGANPQEAFKTAADGWVGFGMAVGQPQENSPFWQGFREICDTLYLPSPHGAAWSNISKVQCIDGHSTSFHSLSNAQKKEIQSWQQPLFEAEMNFFKPRFVISFTGPNYDKILNDSFLDLELAAVDNFDPRHLAVGHSNRYSCMVIRTYHPSYLRKQSKWPIINVICNLISNLEEQRK